MEHKEKGTKNKALAALEFQLLQVQKKVADWLNNKCRNLPASALMVILIIFCSSCASLLVMLIMGKI
ncbi:hypothetical protein [Pedobacter psychrodurus]|uniref:hypothetical protein n=1 Tax=Pedobacter psychrodurus TaxID=2530456 RepID=UPI00292ED802|nr:hypothetical protein [Pedobacter psychrodurus]